MKSATTEGVMSDMTKCSMSTTQCTEQWEINGVGQFLLGLQDTNIIKYVEGALLMDKAAMRQEFHKYLKAETNAALKAKFEEKRGSNVEIGKLLFVTNFLINTPRGSNFYRIKDFTLNRFREKILHEFDNIQRNGGRLPNNDKNDSNIINNADINLQQLIEAHTIDTSNGSHDLQYEGSQTHLCEPDFELSSMGCIICQKNFDRIEEYEEHIEYHGEESDFKSLKTMKKLSSSPMFKLSYQLCVKSHFFGFTLESMTLDNLIIDKIINVRSRSFHYVNHTQMPYKLPSKGRYMFFLDSHLFKISVEQPIVIVFRQQQDNYENADATRKYHVEQHHFMRTEPFPIVHFAINPYRLSSAMLLKQTSPLNSYMPSCKFIKALHTNCDTNNFLFEQSQSFRKYFEEQKSLTLQNMPGAIITMLQIEDVETLNIYRRMTQFNVVLRQFGREVSLILKSTKTAFNETILSPGDEVIMIVEQKSKQTMSLANEDEIIDVILKSNREIQMKFKKNKQKIFFGSIELVMNHRASVKCQKTLPRNCTYTVIFRPGRFTLRQQYRALSQLTSFDHNLLKRFLFPEIDRTMDALADLYNLELHDRTIYVNPEQLNAVKQIAKSNCLQTPFILYGPPGTGKTATIVESIMQLLIQRSDTRILVMAGSNGACDEISVRLLRLIAKTPLCDKKALTRIFSRSSGKRIDNVDETLLEHSNMYGTHFYPHASIMHDYRIVVCTLSVAGKLSMGGFGKSCEDNTPVYTHIFIDEAAASTEAEALMGLTCAISPRASLILSGDHKQLGSVLQSKCAQNLGLGISLMERLLKRECYQVGEDGEYNRQVQSRLRRNYRSHPEIVKLYSELFYDGQLIALAPEDEVNLSEKWYKMPNTNFPIIFHAEFGTTVQSLNSVSLCNHREIDAVMSYVKDFMYFGINGKRLKESDIGIISPYKNQYTRIQEQLNIRNWHQIECGSVETFQGKEKQIIIVSFVRSFSKTVGFLDNPRRLNVTLSRPKSLLILIGNPKTLSLNNDFKSIIDTCKRENSFVGAPLFENVDNNDLNMAFNGMVLCPKSDKVNQKRRRARARKSSTNIAKTTYKKTNAVTTNNKSSDQKTAAAGALVETGKIYTNSKQSPNEIMDKDDIDKFFDSLPRVPETFVYENHKTYEKETCKTILTTSTVENIDGKTTKNKVISTDLVVPSIKEPCKPKLSPLATNIDSKTTKNGIMSIAATNPLHATSGPLSQEQSKAKLSALPAIIDSKTTKNGIIKTAATNSLHTLSDSFKKETSKAILTSSSIYDDSKANKEPSKALLSSSHAIINSKIAKNRIKYNVATNPLHIIPDETKKETAKSILTSSSVNVDSKAIKNTAVGVLPNKKPSTAILSLSPTNANKTVKNGIMNIADTNPLTTTAVLSRIETSKAILTSPVSVDSKTVMNIDRKTSEKKILSTCTTNPLHTVAGLSKKEISKTSSSPVNVENKAVVNTNVPVGLNKKPSKVVLTSYALNKNGIMTTTTINPLHLISVPPRKETTKGMLTLVAPHVARKPMNTNVSNPLTNTAFLSRMETSKALLTPSSSVNVERKTVMNVAIPSNKTPLPAKLLSLPGNVDNKTIKNGIMTTAATNPLHPDYDLSANIDSKIDKNRIMNNAATNPLTTAAFLSRIEASSPVNVVSKAQMNTAFAVESSKERPSNGLLKSSPANVAGNNVSHFIISNNIIEHVDTVTRSYNPVTGRNAHNSEKLNAPLIKNQKSKKSCVLQ